ncbi:MAG TPA: oligosaccharide flippase family protein [Blastocatellia bacterium]|jgi:O-antigen/teichoic acid export membrane protein|nr:oligosaccharide flippase family protein [Blastocatellia bacterium]
MPQRFFLWQDFISGLSSDLRRRSLRHSLITLGASVIRLGISALAVRILARGLGPQDLGTFYVVSAVVLILGTIGDGGLSYTAVREVSRLRSEESTKIPEAAGAFLVLKLAFAGAVVVLVLALGGPLASVVLPDIGNGALLLRLAALTVVTTALSGWASFVAQGLRRFGWVAVSSVGTAVAGLAGFWALSALARLNVTSVVAVGIFTPLASLVLFAPVLWAQRVRFINLRKNAGELLGFSRWLWLSAILSSTTAQLDLMLVKHWSPPEIAGFYALAARLALFADLINQSNFVALLPAVSAQRTVVEHRAFMRSSLLRTLPVAALLLIGALLARAPIEWFFGHQYAAVVPLFRILMLGVAFDLVVTPLILVAFPLNMPRTLAASDLIRVVALSSAAVLWLPLFGAAGAAWAKLAAKAIGGGFTLAMVWWRMRAPVIKRV